MTEKIFLLVIICVHNIFRFVHSKISAIQNTIPLNSYFFMCFKGKSNLKLHEDTGS